MNYILFFGRGPLGKHHSLRLIMQSPYIRMILKSLGPLFKHMIHCLVPSYRFGYGIQFWRSPHEQQCQFIFLLKCCLRLMASVRNSYTCILLHPLTRRLHHHRFCDSPSCHLSEGATFSDVPYFTLDAPMIPWDLWAPLDRWHLCTNL